MPRQITYTDSASIPANDGVDNVLADSKVQNVPVDDNYRVRFAATGSATGLRHQFDADTDIAVQDSLVSTTNRVPLVPDDFIAEFDVRGGSKLFLDVRNSTAGALTYFFTVTLIPHSML